MRFLNISTSKINPTLGHLKHWLRTVLRATTVCSFWETQVPKVLRTLCALRFLTSKCPSCHSCMHFFTSQLPKVLRAWGASDIWTSTRNGVQFFIPHVPTWLHTRRFSELTFSPSGDARLLKNTMFRDFSAFSRPCIFFLLILSLLWSSFFFLSLLWPFPPLLFHPSILSKLWLLNFLWSIMFCTAWMHARKNGWFIAGLHDGDNKLQQTRV